MRPRTVRSASFSRSISAANALARADELADGRFLESLGHKLKSRTSVGKFVSKDGEVGLLARQAVKRKGDDNIDLALPHGLSKLGESRSLSPLRAGMDVSEYRNDSSARAPSACFRQRASCVSRD